MKRASQTPVIKAPKEHRPFNRQFTLWNLFGVTVFIAIVCSYYATISYLPSNFFRGLALGGTYIIVVAVIVIYLRDFIDGRWDKR